MRSIPPRRWRRAPLALAAALSLAAGCARQPTPLETGSVESVAIDDLVAARPENFPEEARPAVLASLAKLIAKRSPAGGGARLAAEPATQALIAFAAFEPEAEEAIDLLLPLLDDPNRDVRYYALRALAPHAADSRVREAAERLRGVDDPLLAGEARLVLR